MRIFSRYLALRFLGPFLFGLGAFALLAFLGDLFDKMNRIATSPASLAVIAEYLLLQVPYWAVRVLPMATLLATLFTVTAFVRSGEYVAVQAAGFESGRFFRPLLVLSLAVGLVSFVAQETLLPACFSRAQRLWRERVHPVWEWDKYFDAILVPSSDRFVSTKLFVVKAGTLERPVMDDYGRRMLVRQVDAETARWDPVKALWVFEKGVVREFDETGALSSVRPFRTLDSDLRTPPRKMVPLQKNPDEMSILETAAEIRRLEELGRSSRRMRTALHQKTAYPFTNLILCAMGIPIALRLRWARRTVAFTAALVLSFLYLWFMEIGWMLGKAGRMPPVAAAWLPNLGFGALAAWLYKKI
ncbi:MAG: LptF/LptG family permease [Elusimicrobiota bacterium]